MMRAVSDWCSDWWPVVLLVVALVAGLAGAVWLGLESDREWQEFKEANGCRLVGKMEGSVVPGVGVGVGVKGAATVVSTTVYIPDKEGWLCADGVTYWR